MRSVVVLFILSYATTSTVVAVDRNFTFGGGLVAISKIMYYGVAVRPQGQTTTDWYWATKSPGYWGWREQTEGSVQTGEIAAFWSRHVPGVVTPNNAFRMISNVRARSTAIGGYVQGSAPNIGTAAGWCVTFQICHWYGEGTNTRVGRAITPEFYAYGNSTAPTYMARRWGSGEFTWNDDVQRNLVVSIQELLDREIFMPPGAEPAPLDAFAELVGKDILDWVDMSGLVGIIQDTPNSGGTTPPTTEHRSGTSRKFLERNYLRMKGGNHET